jgi:TonB family protein
MRWNALIAAAAVLTLTSTKSGILASEAGAASFVQSALGNLPVEVVPCEKMPEGAGAGTAWTCAKATADFEAFRAAWDAVVKDAEKADEAPRPLTEWQTQMGGYIRWYVLSEKWIVVSFDNVGKQVLISFAKDRAGVFPLVKGVVAPKRRAQELPSDAVVQDARGGLKPNAQGVVVLSAVVRSDGTVSNVEVLGCMPRYKGLEQAAMRTLKRWKYDPGTVDGTRVDVAMSATFSYAPGGSYRATETGDYSIRMDPPRSFGAAGSGKNN